MQGGEIVKGQSYDVQIRDYEKDIGLDDVYPTQFVPSGLSG